MRHRGAHPRPIEAGRDRGKPLRIGRLPSWPVARLPEPVGAECPHLEPHDEGTNRRSGAVILAGGGRACPHASAGGGCVGSADRSNSAGSMTSTYGS